MGKTSPETIVFREANYLSWRLLTNENYVTKYIFMIKNVLKTRRECSTYLATACRHHRRLKMMKKDE